MWYIAKCKTAMPLRQWLLSSREDIVHRLLDSAMTVHRQLWRQAAENTALKYRILHTSIEFVVTQRRVRWWKKTYTMRVWNARLQGQLRRDRSTEFTGAELCRRRSQSSTCTGNGRITWPAWRHQRIRQFPTETYQTGRRDDDTDAMGCRHGNTCN